MSIAFRSTVMIGRKSTFSSALAKSTKSFDDRCSWEAFDNNCSWEALEACKKAKIVIVTNLVLRSLRVNMEA